MLWVYAPIHVAALAADCHVLWCASGRWLFWLGTAAELLCGCAL